MHIHYLVFSLPLLLLDYLENDYMYVYVVLRLAVNSLRFCSIVLLMIFLFDLYNFDLVVAMWLVVFGGMY